MQSRVLITKTSVTTMYCTYLETANNTWGSCSHLFRASTELVLRWGRGSIKMDSAHKIPALEQSCLAGREREKKKE